MSSTPRLLLIFALVLACAPVSAELYKWVDERGITNYSGEPPPAAATANKLSRVENKISVYTPDDGVLQATKAMRERAIKALAEPDPVRSPVARIAVEQSGYEQCISSGRIGCDDLYPNYYSAAYVPWGGYPVRRAPPARLLPPRPAHQNAARVSRGLVR